MSRGSSLVGNYEIKRQSKGADDKYMVRNEKKVNSNNTNVTLGAMMAL